MLSFTRITPGVRAASDLAKVNTDLRKIFASDLSSEDKAAVWSEYDDLKKELVIAAAVFILLFTVPAYFLRGRFGILAAYEGLMAILLHVFCIFREKKGLPNYKRCAKIIEGGSEDKSETSDGLA